MQQQQVRVEDMPLEKKLEVLKKHNQYHGYDEGRFIDAQDTVNTWCLGHISQIIDAKTIKVHYDGWSTKWDIVSADSRFSLIKNSLIFMNLTISVRPLKSITSKSRHSESFHAVTLDKQELRSAKI
jgi:hypothetical protein